MSQAQEGVVDFDLDRRLKKVEAKFAALVTYLNMVTFKHGTGALSMDLALLMSQLDDGEGAREHYLSRVVR